MDRMLERTNPLNQPGILGRLGVVQRVLPVMILVFVVIYELVFEFLIGGSITATVRFVLEVLIFGFFGATVTWATLGWIRRRVEREAEDAATAVRRDRILATITEDSADAIYLLDPKGMIQTWNHGAEQLYGYPAAQVIGKHFELLLPKTLRMNGELEHMDAELDMHGFLRNYITQRVAQDGRMLTVEVTRTLLRDEDGKVFGSAAIVRDVTERERIAEQTRELNRHLETEVAQRTQALSEANQELRRRHAELEKANAELQQLDALKSEFVSLVSHELRAPLANISASLQLLLSESNTETLTPHQRDMLLMTNEQSDRLARLVKGILNVSRVEAGQMMLTPEALDMHMVIERALENWRSCDKDHVYIGPTTANLPSVWADRDRIQEVLTNLIDNAFKYSPPGSTIRVDAQAAEDQMVVYVADQGQGIPPEELQKIFDKFHRVERGDARQSYGYGLGLYISRKLVESMGGNMWVESDVGQGSIFYFSIPLAGHAV